MKHLAVVCPVALFASATLLIAPVAFAADAPAKIEQGMTENSNVDPILMMTQMVAVSRAYEQVANMMSETGSLSDESIQRLGKVN